MLFFSHASPLASLGVKDAHLAKERARDLARTEANRLPKLLQLPVHLSVLSCALRTQWSAVNGKLHFFIFFVSAKLVALDLRVEVVELLCFIQPLELRSPPSESFLDLLARILLFHL